MNTFILKYLRTTNNLTIQDIAEYLGVSKAAVCKWEKGDDIKIEHLYSISILFNVSINELLDGELNDDSKNEYFIKEYDLSKYKFDEITDENLDLIKEFYECYFKINKRFYYLLEKYLSNRINDKELKLFKTLENYYEYDLEYIKFHENINEEFEQEKLFYLQDFGIQEILIDKVKKYNTSKEVLRWELSKFFKFKEDLKIEQVMESNNKEAIKYLLENLSQQEKDYYFNKHLCYEDEEIKMYSENLYEQSIILNMLNCNAQFYYDVIFDYYKYELDKYINHVNYSILNLIEKKVTLDPKRNNIYNMLKEKKFAFDSLNFWKNFTLEEYKELIDKNKTKFYKTKMKTSNEKIIDLFNKYYLESK